MIKETIAPNAKTEMEYLKDGRILILRLHGFIKTEEMKRDMALLNQTIEERGVQALLVNHHDAKVFSAEIQSMIAQNRSAMGRKGVRKIAVILPEDIFALAAIKKISHETPNIDVKTFQSETDGLNWLRD